MTPVSRASPVAARPPHGPHRPSRAVRSQPVIVQRIGGTTTLTVDDDVIVTRAELTVADLSSSSASPHRAVRRAQVLREVGRARASHRPVARRPLESWAEWGAVYAAFSAAL